MLKFIKAKQVKRNDIVIVQLHPERPSIRDRVVSVARRAAGTVVEIEVPGAVYERGLDAQVILVHRKSKAKRKPEKKSPPAYQPQVEEIKAAYAWIQEHGKSCEKLAVGPIEYRYDISSGIGLAVYLVCPCGSEGNITDYESW